MEQEVAGHRARRAASSPRWPTTARGARWCSSAGSAGAVRSPTRGSGTGATGSSGRPRRARRPRAQPRDGVRQRAWTRRALRRLRRNRTISATRGNGTGATGSTSRPRRARRPAIRTRWPTTAARGRVVLFGGCGDLVCPLGDTWEWDGTSWVERTPATSPPARLRITRWPTTAGRGRVVLFGGYTGLDIVARHVGVGRDRMERGAGRIASRGPLPSHDDVRRCDRGCAALWRSQQRVPWGHLGIRRCAARDQLSRKRRSRVPVGRTIADLHSTRDGRLVLRPGLHRERSQRGRCGRFGVVPTRHHHRDLHGDRRRREDRIVLDVHHGRGHDASGGDRSCGSRIPLAAGSHHASRSVHRHGRRRLRLRPPWCCWSRSPRAIPTTRRAAATAPRRATCRALPPARPTSSCCFGPSATAADPGARTACATGLPMLRAMTRRGPVPSR